jgi:hypothetical protein
MLEMQATRRIQSFPPLTPWKPASQALQRDAEFVDDQSSVKMESWKWDMARGSMWRLWYRGNVEGIRRAEEYGHGEFGCREFYRWGLLCLLCKCWIRSLSVANIFILLKYPMGLLVRLDVKGKGHEQM